MTKRVVSLMGAAGVAAMVILAGCSDGPGAVDHTKALDGTWTVTTMATVPNRQETRRRYRCQQSLRQQSSTAPA